MKTRIFTLLLISFVLLILYSGLYVAGTLYLNHYNVLSLNKTTLPDSVIAYQENEHMMLARPNLLSFIPGSAFDFSGVGFNTSYRINSFGVRGNDIKPLSQDKRRVLLLGDSQTEGHGVNIHQRFSALLKSDLAKSDIDLVNLSIQGASPIYYAANLNRYLKLKPRAIVMVLFDNDLYEDRQRERVYNRIPYTTLDSYGEVNVIKTIFHTIKASLRFPNTEFENIIGLNNQQSLSNQKQQELNQVSPYLIDASLFESHWLKTQRYLDYIAKAAKLQNIDVYISYLTLENLSPSKDPAFHNHARMFGRLIENYTLQKNIPYFSFVNPVSQYFALKKPEELSIKGDGHASVSGHQFIYKHLTNWLSKSLFKSKL